MGVEAQSESGTRKKGLRQEEAKECLIVPLLPVSFSWKVFALRFITQPQQFGVYFGGSYFCGHVTCGVLWSFKRGVEQGGGKSPFSLLSEPISPSFLLLEPISPSSLNASFSFSPSSLLFPPISPSSQLCLGHFSLLPVLFLPPHAIYITIHK